MGKILNQIAFLAFLLGALFLPQKSFATAENEKTSSFLEMKKRMVKSNQTAQDSDDISNEKKKKKKRTTKAKVESGLSKAETPPPSPPKPPEAKTEVNNDPHVVSHHQEHEDTPAHSRKLKRKKRPEANDPLPPSRAAIRVTQEVSPIPESPQEQETRLTKNWGGSRKTLSAKGIDLALIYKGEINSVLSGGKRRATEYLGNIDFRTSLDGEKLIGWKGGSGFIYFLGDHGGDPSKNIGDVQVTSNIETPADSFKLYEAWLQQLLYEDRVSILLGLHDLNSEFYVTESSGLFFNSSFGVGRDLSQTGVNGPSIFPTTAPALRIRTEPSKSFYLQWAAFNGQAGDPQNPKGTHVRLNASDGVLLISEIAYLRGKEDSKQLPGKYGIGYWAYTKTFNHQTDSTSTDPNDSTAKVPVKANSHGIYFLLDQSFTEKFSLFFRYGIASTEVNPIKYCIGSGFVFTGLLPFRDKDRLGVAVAQVEGGNEYRKAQSDAGTPVKGGETTFEINYRIEALPGVALQPDFQFIKSPSGNPQLKDAAALAFRFEVSF